MLLKRRVLVLLGLLLLAGIATASTDLSKSSLSSGNTGWLVHWQRESVDYYSYRPLPHGNSAFGCYGHVLAG